VIFSCTREGSFFGRLHGLAGDFPDAFQLENGILQMFGRGDESFELLVQLVPQGLRASAWSWL